MTRTWTHRQARAILVLGIQELGRCRNGMPHVLQQFFSQRSNDSSSISQQTARFVSKSVETSQQGDEDANAPELKLSLPGYDVRWHRNQTHEKTD